MEAKKPILRRNRKKCDFTDSFLVKYFFKGILAIITILIFLTLVQCTVKKPESPTWISDYSIPAISRAYHMPEIISKLDQPNITMDSAGEVAFGFSQELDTVRAEGELTLAGNSCNVIATLGKVNLSPQSPSPESFDLSDYVPLSLDTMVETSFDLEYAIPPRSDYGWIEVESGGVTVTLTNEFGLPLDTIIVTLVDLESQQTIGIDTFPDPGLLNGATDSITVDLGGNRISNELRLDYHCHTPGGKLGSISDNILATSVNFTDGILVTAAEAEIPYIQRDTAQQIEIAQNDIIQSAVISSGAMHLTIDNLTNATVELGLRLPDFHQEGAELATINVVPPNMTENVTIELNGAIFEPADQIRPQEVRIEMAAIIDSTGPDQVEIHDYDSIGIFVSIMDLGFSSVTGVMDSTEVALNDIAVDVEIPRGFESIQLVEAIMTLEIVSSLQFPGELNIEISGNNGKQLNLAGSILPGTISNPATGRIVETDIASFIYPIPSVMSLNGIALFGDGITFGTISSNDFIIPRLNVVSPIEVIIEESFFITDTSSIDIGQKDIHRLTDHTKRVEFVGELVNHLPFGADIMIFMDSDAARLNETEATLVIGPLTIEAGEIGPLNTVINPAASPLSIPLDSGQVKILENEQIYAAQQITLHGTDGRQVRVLGTDFISIQGIFEISYEFDGNF